MSGDGHSPNGNGSGDAGTPRMQILAQYVKDLSFENPGAPMNPAVRPAIDLGVDLQARRVEGDHYEVELRLRVSAQHEEKTLFLMELSYAAIMMIQGVPEEVAQQVLLIEAPHLMFPFARRVVADTIRDGGMPPLMIEPIDFAALYRTKLEKDQQALSPTASA
ncbi:MAG: protein-export chaperone SecB [Proteobacteria bacterium]|nr:protein-export chaperone SecB [Pseudomonadota bacterium]